MSDSASVKPCPICKKPAQERYKPFCSKRCADIDLNKWFTGRYAVPLSDEEQLRIEHDDFSNSD